MSREQFRGQRVAIAGMGVSGLAVAKAVQQCGGHPVVFDQNPGDVPRILAAVDQLQSAGIEAVTSWHGRMDSKEFDTLVVSPGLPPNHPVFSDMEGKIMGEIEFAYQVAEAPILAITGTNGKSTSTVMLWLTLAGAGEEVALCGNIAGSGYPEKVFSSAAMEVSPSGFLVAEVSSAQLETITKFRPKVATITNITEDHLDRYGSMAAYRAAKFNLISQLKEDDFVVLNLDQDTVSEAEIREKNPEVKIIGFSASGRAVGTGSSRREGEWLWLGERRLKISDLPFFGEHNIVNAMCAYEMARCVSEKSGLVDGLLEFRNLENRMEPVGQKRGISVINNSMCTNPEAVVASSRSLEGKQHILMGGKTKNMDFSPVKEYLGSVPHEVYVFGPEPEKINGMIGGNWPSFLSLEDAFRSAILRAKSGEVILLAPGCASAEPFANFRERGDAFRKLAMEWLNDDTKTES